MNCYVPSLLTVFMFVLVAVSPTNTTYVYERSVLTLIKSVFYMYGCRQFSASSCFTYFYTNNTFITSKFTIWYMYGLNFLLAA
jgi:hypothetical protein